VKTLISWRRRLPTGLVLGAVGLSVALHRHGPYWFGRQVADVAALEAKDGEIGYKTARLRAQLAEKDPAQPSVVMLGSSQTAFGLNPTAMRHSAPGTPGGPVVYNFGVMSSGPVVQLMNLRRLVRRGVRPDLLLVEASPRMLFNSVSCSYNPHFNLELTRILPEDMDLFRRYDAEWKQLRADWGIYQLVQWCNRQHGCESLKVPLMEVVKTPVPEIGPFTDRNGWNGILQDIHGKRNTPPAMVDASCAHCVGFMTSEPLDMRYVTAYRETLELCQKEKIRAALVRMPEPPYLRGHMPKDLLACLDEIYAHQAQLYGAEIVDARAYLGTNMFNDVAHFTVEGSAEFTRKLEDDYLHTFISRHRATAGGRETAARN
jgi:hypothetical protein